MENASYAHSVVDPLPTWNDCAAKHAITEFVKAVTQEGSRSYVPPSRRIAVFDHDGTLWCEQPVPFQLAYAVYRVKTMAGEFPEWQILQPFKAALDNDFDTLAELGDRALLQLLTATHANMSTDAFTRLLTDSLATARHPRFQRLLTEMVYQPMVQLLAYLRHLQFKTYIVTGGPVEFLRVFSEAMYGVPPEQVIGSTTATVFQDLDGEPALYREHDAVFMDDGAGRPVTIHRFIGQRPIAAFGNADGDLQMLEWTACAPGQTLVMLLHHDDAEREYAYDSEAAFGRLDRALVMADIKGWPIVSMKDDWNTIFDPVPPVDYYSRDRRWHSKSPVSRTCSTSAATTSIRRLSIRIEP